MRVKSGNVERIVTDSVGKRLIESKIAVEVPDGNIQKDISKMKLDELKTLAKENGIEDADSMKKEELLNVLKDVV